MSREVTVRAYGGELKRLVAVDQSGKLVYVLNPHSLDRAASGLTEPVGVPAEDVSEGWRKEVAH